MNTDAWIGAALGFASALLCVVFGAWIQSRLRIKEQRLQREQLRRDRAEDEAARVEAERQKLIKVLSDLRTLKPLEDVARHIGESVRESERRHFRASWGGNLLTWWSDEQYSDSVLQRMSFTELSLLYTASLGVFGFCLAGDRQRSELDQRMDEIGRTLRDIEHRLSTKG